MFHQIFLIIATDTIYMLPLFYVFIYIFITLICCLSRHQVTEFHLPHRKLGAALPNGNTYAAHLGTAMEIGQEREM